MNQVVIRDGALAQATTALPEAIEAALGQGDIARLSPAQRVTYYRAVCESVGLNWLTRPLDILKGEDGKYRFYFRKEATDQLAKLYRVTFKTVDKSWIDDETYAVTMQASDPVGRTVEEVGIVAIGNAKGQSKANLLMKAHTKARRRAVMALVGTGWQMYESDDRGQHMQFDPVTGELADDRPQPVPLMVQQPQEAIADIYGEIGEHAPVTHQEGQEGTTTTRQVSEQPPAAPTPQKGKREGASVETSPESSAREKTQPKASERVREVSTPINQDIPRWRFLLSEKVTAARQALRPVKKALRSDEEMAPHFAYLDEATRRANAGLGDSGTSEAMGMAMVELLDEALEAARQASTAPRQREEDALPLPETAEDMPL